MGNSVLVPLLIRKAASPKEEFQRAAGTLSLSWGLPPGAAAPDQPTADTLWLRNSSCPVPIRIAQRKPAGARNRAKSPFLTFPGCRWLPLPLNPRCQGCLEAVVTLSGWLQAAWGPGLPSSCQAKVVATGPSRWHLLIKAVTGTHGTRQTTDRGNKDSLIKIGTNQTPEHRVHSGAQRRVL